MSSFERYLTVWVALCIIAGVAFGHSFPAVFHMIGSAEIAKVNLPVAVLIWLMIIPMLVKIDFAALSRVQGALAGHRRHAVHQLGRKAVLDGVPGVALHRLGVQAISAAGADQQLYRRSHHPCGRPLHRDGVRLEQSVRWRAAFHAEPGRALNDIIMVFAFAPIVALLLGLSAITIPWETLLLSVVLYIVIPVVIAQIVRRGVLASGGGGLGNCRSICHRGRRDPACSSICARVCPTGAANRSTCGFAAGIDWRGVHRGLEEHRRDVKGRKHREQGP